MTHICNDCKYQDICKEKFKNSTGLLCENKWFRKETESNFIKENRQYGRR